MSLFTGEANIATVGGPGISVTNGSVADVVASYQRHLAITFAAENAGPPARFVLDHRPATQGEMLMVIPDTLGLSAVNVLPPGEGMPLTDHSKVRCVDIPQGGVLLAVLPGA